SLFWRISALLFLLLFVLGIAYVLITSYSARMYFKESHQKLYGGIAAHTVNVVKPLVDGQVDTTSIQDIMHSMMVINPSVEVYLLDMEGQIVTYVAPYKKVKLKEVDLAPVERFIKGDGQQLVLGDDPRNPGEQNVFSAAPILEDGKRTGYIYVVLASEEYKSVTGTLMGSYMLRLGLRTFFLTWAMALLIGLLAVWLLTRNLRRIADQIRSFQAGHYSARLDEKSFKGELGALASTMNEMAATIEMNIEELKQVEHLRRELIANVSHDLRTPLAIMHGYTETLLLKNQDLSEAERAGYLQIVLDSTERLKKMVSQLFELSKLEAKQIQPKKEPFFITELAQDMIHKYEILAKEKDIEIQLELDPNIPLVFADVGLVERVLQNLLDNALKFTPSNGKVTLEIEEKGQSVQVKVLDTGPGVPDHVQSMIFDRFQQAKHQGDKTKMGAGLGLAIARKIMEIHDSTIGVMNRPTSGAAFFFDLPIYAAPQT
ncbi:MAG: HAMP domain-containing sensor histidine kinase, partial [Bacteroidota bacterium]